MTVTIGNGDGAREMRGWTLTSEVIPHKARFVEVDDLV